MHSFFHQRFSRQGLHPSAFIALTCASVALTACSQELSLNLSQGQCIILPDSPHIATVNTTECSEPHHAEVIDTITVNARELPSTSVLDNQARQECAIQFESYVGVPTQKSALDMKWLLPSATSWKSGDRTIACIVVAPNNQTVDTPLKGLGM